MASRTLVYVVGLAGIGLASCVAIPQFPDLEQYIARRDMCDHFRGEIPDPEQVEQMKQTIEQINKFCPGSDAALAELKARYASDPKIMGKLNSYDPRIEREKTNK